MHFRGSAAVGAPFGLECSGEAFECRDFHLQVGRSLTLDCRRACIAPCFEVSDCLACLKEFACKGFAIILGGKLGYFVVVR